MPFQPRLGSKDCPSLYSLSRLSAEGFAHLLSLSLYGSPFHELAAPARSCLFTPGRSGRPAHSHTLEAAAWTHTQGCPSPSLVPSHRDLLVGGKPVLTSW